MLTLALMILPYSLTPLFAHEDPGGGFNIPGSANPSADELKTKGFKVLTDHFGQKIYMHVSGVAYAMSARPVSNWNQANDYCTSLLPAKDWSLPESGALLLPAILNVKPLVNFFEFTTHEKGVWGFIANEDTLNFAGTDKVMTLINGRGDEAEFFSLSSVQGKLVGPLAIKALCMRLPKNIAQLSHTHSIRAR